MVHEQKFKDLLSSTQEVSVERPVLDLESEVHERPGCFSHWGKNITVHFPFCHCNFLYVVKPLMAMLALLPISSSL